MLFTPSESPSTSSLEPVALFVLRSLEHYSDSITALPGEDKKSPCYKIACYFVHLVVTSLV